MRDEVRVKLDPVTLQLLREEKFPNLQPVDSEGVHRVDKALCGYRGPPRLWKDAVSGAATDLGLEPKTEEKSSLHESCELSLVCAR